LWRAFAVVGKEAIAICLKEETLMRLPQRGFLCALIYVIGQQIEVVRDLIYRYFYAVSDTKTPALKQRFGKRSKYCDMPYFSKIFGRLRRYSGNGACIRILTAEDNNQFRKNIGFKGSFRGFIQLLSNIAISLITIGAC
jgi:hypothetical protein